MNKKYVGIMVRYSNEASDAAVTCLLAKPVCNIATAETLFNGGESEESNLLEECGGMCIGQRQRHGRKTQFSA